MDIKQIDDVCKVISSKVEKLIESDNCFGFDETELRDLDDAQRKLFFQSEFYALLFSKIGEITAEHLWNYKQSIKSEWFDHRLHILYPEKWFPDFWTLSADNVLPFIPLGGTLLDLCSGDGFYDYHFYSKRAGRVYCIERDQKAVVHAQRVHQADNIEYVHADVLTFEPDSDVFDVAVIRGAIEHFHFSEQEVIIEKAKRALKPGGWFIGDTPQKIPNGEKQHPDHHFEWESEAEMRRILLQFFSNVESFSMVSENEGQTGGTRTTLFWRCQK